MNDPHDRRAGLSHHCPDSYLMAIAAGCSFYVIAYYRPRVTEWWNAMRQVNAPVTPNN